MAGQVSVAQARDLWANKPGTATMQNAAQAVGNGTDLSVAGYGMACLQISGEFVGSVTFLGSADGLNFAAIPAVPRGSGPSVFSAAAPGLYDVDCRGLQDIRARVNEYTSGSITVVGVAEPFAGYNPSLELKGRNIQELVIANQTEIRDTTETYFNIEIPSVILRSLKDWEIYITDSHSTNASNSLDMSFAIGSNTQPLLSFFTTTNVAYRWKFTNAGNAGEKILITTKKAQLSRDLSSSIKNISLTQLLLNSEYKFYTNTTEDTGLTLKMDINVIQDMKKALMAMGSTSSARFYIKYPVAPTAGSITVAFRGWIN